MRNMMVLLSFCSMLFMSNLLADEIILQNGVNGYSGCEDTYLSDKSGQNENYGGSSMLSLQGYH